MRDLLLDSLAERPEDYFESTRAPNVEISVPPAAEQIARAVAAEEIHDGEHEPSVEGLPYHLIKLYAEIAARHAVVRQPEEGVWYARVHDIDGAWGDGESEKEALQALEEGIIGWVAVKRRIGAKIPLMEGLDLNRAS